MKQVFSPRTSLLTLLLAMGYGFSAVAQQQPRGFSLKEAIEFATEQNITVKNTQLDATSAEARINEIKAAALPQVNIAGQVQYNPIIQKVVIPAGGFGAPASSTGTAASDGVQTIKLSTNFVGNTSATLNQLLFDASYKVGLKAAATYRELAQRNIKASKITVAQQVAKAYYGVLVNEERAKLLDLNINRTDTLLYQTKAQNKQGFVEKIDVDRLEVQLNNLKSDRQNTQNLIGLSYYLLKYQMGLGVNDDITLTDRIQDIDLETLAQDIVQDENFDYTNRIEYQTLQTQIKLADYDIQNTAAKYYPRASFFANYGYNNGRNAITDLLTKQWFNSSAVGLTVSVPVFDGFAKKYQSQQQKITLQKTQNSGIQLKNSIDLELKQANITLTNSLQTLRTQKRNRDLAEEIVRVTRIKYQEGVGSNIEVLNAETSLREAQTNYFAALYDFLITKVDQDKARGTLYTGN